MSSNGIEGLIVETHNWGKSVAFWRDLGERSANRALPSKTCRRARHRSSGQARRDKVRRIAPPLPLQRSSARW